MTRDQRYREYERIRELLALPSPEGADPKEPFYIDDGLIEELRERTLGKRGARYQQYKINDYAWKLCKSIKAYEFPPVTYDFKKEDYERVNYHRGNNRRRFKYVFKSGREIRHSDMSKVESQIKHQLFSQYWLEVKYGLSNVLYWGYSGKQKGIRPYRVGEFWERVTKGQILEFMGVAKGSKDTDLVLIKNIGMPEFSRMPFVSKVRMFLDPCSYPVLDSQIAKFSNSEHFPPLQNLTIYRKNQTGERIDITQDNEEVYVKWASWCRGVAKVANAAYPRSPRNDLRAVDVERAIFQLSQSDEFEAWRLLQGPKPKN